MSVNLILHKLLMPVNLTLYRIADSGASKFYSAPNWCTVNLTLYQTVDSDACEYDCTQNCWLWCLWIWPFTKLPILIPVFSTPTADFCLLWLWPYTKLLSDDRECDPTPNCWLSVNVIPHQIADSDGCGFDPVPQTADSLISLKLNWSW